MSKLIIGFGDLNQTYLQDKYPKNFKFVNKDDYNFIVQGKLNNQILIQYLQDISNNMNMYDIVYTQYDINVTYCLNNLNTSYTLAYREYDNINQTVLNELPEICNKLEIPSNSTLENELGKEYGWIIKDTQLILNQNKNRKLTLQNIMDDNVIVTEEDIREVKEVETKIKVALLLQAKRTLTRTLKLLDVLDVLCDSLVDRISSSVNVADTASLMTTVQFITNSINEANKFVYTLISNDKIQNFFIVDNSNVINISSDERVDIDKREKVRKAIEVVLDNIDHFQEGQFDQLQNPNIVEVQNNESTES